MSKVAEIDVCLALAVAALCRAPHVMLDAPDVNERACNLQCCVVYQVVRPSKSTNTDALVAFGWSWDFPRTLSPYS